MRRYFQFGAVEGNNRVLVPESNGGIPYWISMQHKEQVYEILMKGWGGGQAREAIYIQQGYLDEMAAVPANDCPANHLPQGYSMIGSLYPLSQLLLTGFFDRNFASTPAIFKESYTKPIAPYA